MTVRYSIVENTLVDGRKVHRAMVHPTATITAEEFIDKIAQDNTTLTKADAVGMVEEIFRNLILLLRDGYTVRLPFGVYRPSIRGAFENPEDLFDPRRHEIVISVSPGIRSRQAMRREARAERAVRVGPAPNVTSYADHSSGQKDGVLTPGGVGRVYGSRLKFDPDDPQQGVFFLAGAVATPADNVILVRRRTCSLSCRRWRRASTGWKCGRGRPAARTC